MLQRFAATTVLTVAVGGVLFGAAPAMASTMGGDKPGGNAVKNHKGSDNDKFSNRNAQLCVTDDLVIVGSVVDNAGNDCKQRVAQENEGDESDIGEG
jgi:hypothetical protein